MTFPKYETIKSDFHPFYLNENQEPQCSGYLVITKISARNRRYPI